MGVTLVGPDPGAIHAKSGGHPEQCALPDIFDNVNQGLSACFGHYGCFAGIGTHIELEIFRPTSRFSRWEGRDPLPIS